MIPSVAQIIMQQNRHYEVHGKIIYVIKGESRLTFEYKGIDAQLMKIEGTWTQAEIKDATRCRPCFEL